MSTDNTKVLYISLTNGAGGAEQILLMAARVTDSQVIFLKEEMKYPLNLSESRIRATYLSRKSLFRGFILLLKALIPFRKGFVIISSHPYLNAYLGILKRIGYLQSLLITRESTSVFLRFKGLKRLSYKIAYWLGYPAIDLLICQTKDMKAQLLDAFDFFASKKVIVIDNPIDINYVTKKGDEKIDDPVFKVPFICSAGRLIPIKGFDVLIKAFSLVAQDFPEHKLLILGDGAEKANLERLISDLNLNNRIVLRGFVSNPFVYFKKANVCVVSSIREGFPNVLLQMMAVNNRVISTNCAGGIESFDSVEIVNVNDPVNLATAFKTLLSKEKSDSNTGNLQLLSLRSPESFVNSVLKEVI